MVAESETFSNRNVYIRTVASVCRYRQPIQSISDRLLDRILLPEPAINFVVNRNGAFLAAVNPFSRTVLLYDTEAGKTARRWQLGMSPSEVQFQE